MSSLAVVLVGVMVTATLAGLGFLIRKWIGGLETAVAVLTDRMLGRDGVTDRLIRVEDWQTYHDHGDIFRPRRRVENGP